MSSSTTSVATNFFWRLLIRDPIYTFVEFNSEQLYSTPWNKQMFQSYEHSVTSGHIAHHSPLFLFIQGDVYKIWYTRIHVHTCSLQQPPSGCWEMFYAWYCFSYLCNPMNLTRWKTKAAQTVADSTFPICTAREAIISISETQGLGHYYTHWVLQSIIRISRTPSAQKRCLQHRMREVMISITELFDPWVEIQYITQRLSC